MAKESGPMASFLTISQPSLVSIIKFSFSNTLLFFPEIRRQGPTDDY
jgi:hypothetical protein